MFLTPAALLERMLENEARHEAFYLQFPHLRPLALLYDHYSAPIKMLLLTLVKQRKPATPQEA